MAHQLCSVVSDMADEVEMVPLGPEVVLLVVVAAYQFCPVAV